MNSRDFKQEGNTVIFDGMPVYQYDENTDTSFTYIRETVYRFDSEHDASAYVYKMKTLKEELRKEYELYMKKVTDNFICMQSETTNGTMSQMFIVDWKGGLDWSAVRIEGVYRDGNLMEENRRYNAEVAEKYLIENTLSYDDWYIKYKKQNNER